MERTKEENRREKERLEGYFQTLVKNLPGGVAVVRYGKDGGLKPEFLSDGFAAMTGMTGEQAWELYAKDALAGVHPDDRTEVQQKMAEFLEQEQDHCELIYRLRKGGGGYLWVKNTLSLIRYRDDEHYIYAMYHDITGEREEQEKLREKYRELLLQHYRMPDSDTLVLGHCNITKRTVQEIIDYTGLDLPKRFGYRRDDFFRGLAGMMVDDDQRVNFLNRFLSDAALAAFGREERTISQECLVRIWKEKQGRYVRFNMNMVETPDSGDITGILTVTDVTEKTMAERVLYNASVRGYDFVLDLDVFEDHYRVLSKGEQVHCMPPDCGSHLQRIQYMVRDRVVPRDQQAYYQGLEPERMLERLKKEGTYSFVFSVYNESGGIEIKNISISPVDLRIGRVCLVRSDITASMQEQQGLLNTIAYTFDMMARISVENKRVTVYTRQTVLESLSPRVFGNYREAVEVIAGGMPEIREFDLAWILSQLEQKPLGYDFVFTCREKGRICYKQVNVLWGDENHQTICLVRADVTELLSAERQSKEALEQALDQARKANQAKSDFLSSMSHDIRTPMNAIMGMTTLAMVDPKDSSRVMDCLQKISAASRHLLSLINDVLDMNKIEQNKITLNQAPISMTDMLGQLEDMIGPQARQAELDFHVIKKNISHPYFLGDELRINQILINLLSNALKFTPGGGRIEFIVEELPSQKAADAVRYHFTVKDTGIGIGPELIDRIFEPFVRSQAVAWVEGTGLGLSITSHLVELMGGRISVDSRPGEGSAFHVEMEFAMAEEGKIRKSGRQRIASGAGTAGEEHLFSGRHFLVVEDNAINQEILCRLLTLYGARGTARNDGREAVEEFRSTQPGTYDAILMDIRMPGMDGYEATRAIRGMNRPDAGQIPIFAMTANAFAEDVRAAEEAGMNGHLAKPLDISKLKETLSNIPV